MRQTFLLFILFNFGFINAQQGIVFTGTTLSVSENPNNPPNTESDPNNVAYNHFVGNISYDFNGQAVFNDANFTYEVIGGQSNK